MKNKNILKCIIVLAVLLGLVLILRPRKVVEIDLADVTKVILGTGSGEHVDLTDPNEIGKICAMVQKMRCIPIKYAGGHGGYSYSVSFYLADGRVESFTMNTEKIIRKDDLFRYVFNGKDFFRYLDELLP
ncbi:MAG: hypothetical protein K6G60_08010 [Lachnospiraceae bacterium]|nr:hypothetical protein [Lachnospiraceae bacterium]